MRERSWPSPEAFLAHERDAFRPYEAILDLDPAALDDGPRAHGWSARDVLSHLVGRHHVATEVARELAAGPTSPRKARADEEWEARGDDINEEVRREWAALPVEAFRVRARAAVSDLRLALAQVPVERWWEDDESFDYFLSELQGHYDDHRSDLATVLGRASVGETEAS